MHRNSARSFNTAAFTPCSSGIHCFEARECWCRSENRSHSCLITNCGCALGPTKHQNLAWMFSFHEGSAKLPPSTSPPDQMEAANTQCPCGHDLQMLANTTQPPHDQAGSAFMLATPAFGDTSLVMKPSLWSPGDDNIPRHIPPASLPDILNRLWFDRRHEISSSLCTGG